MHFLVIFAPHILQVKVITPMERMSLADPFPVLAVKAGRMYVSAVVMITLPKSFHLITVLCTALTIMWCAKRESLSRLGMKSGCMEGESVRGQGEVYTVKGTNYFNYSELWM